MSQPTQTATTPPSIHSPVSGIALAVAGLFYLVFMAKVSLPQEPGLFIRILLGLGGLAIGGGIYTAALNSVQTLLKAIVEILGAALLLTNALMCVLVYTHHEALILALKEAGLASEKHDIIPLILIMGGCLFLADALFFILLYPLAQIAGTSVKLPDDLYL